MDKHLVSTIISKYSGKIEKIQITPLMGGSIHQVSLIIAGHHKFVLKLTDISNNDMFEKEVNGLELLRNANCIRIPQTIGNGTMDGVAFIVMEYINRSACNAAFWKDFGLRLANLHKMNDAAFGLHFDNYIGSLLQYNNFKKDGIEFFIKNFSEKDLVFNQ